MNARPTDQKLCRCDIVQIVARLIAEEGLETLTMRNIARHVGCSVGTLPHYFDSKDDIVVAAFNWSNERILGQLEDFHKLGLSELPHSDIQLKNPYPLLSASMPIDEQSEMEWRVRLCLWDYAVTNEDMRDSVNTIAKKAIDSLDELIKYLQKSKEITTSIDHKTIAMTLYHMCVGAGFNMLHTPIDERKELLKPLFSYIGTIRIDEVPFETESVQQD